MGGEVPGWGEARRTPDREAPSLWFTWGLMGRVSLELQKHLRVQLTYWRRRLCAERMSDLSENLHELGLDGVAGSEELAVEG